MFALKKYIKKKKEELEMINEAQAEKEQVTRVIKNSMPAQVK